MGKSRELTRLLSSGALCLLILPLGSCRDPSFMGKSIWTIANNWGPVGHPAISSAYISSTSVAVAPDGASYVAFKDAAGHANVVSFTGAGWASVDGAGLPGAVGGSMQLAFDPNGVLYLALTAGSPYAVSVMRYTSATGWLPAGNAGLSGNAGDVTGVTLAIDPAGTPCVAYVDPSTNKATVMKLQGATWMPVGPAGGFTGAGASNVALAFDAHGTPFVAFTDGTAGNRESAMTFDGSSWLYLGSQGFSTASVDNVSVAVDTSGVLYAACREHVADYVPSVMKYDGSAWSYVGPQGLSGGGVAGVTLVLSQTGVPYLAYEDDLITNPDGSHDPVTVVRFSAGQWIPVGRQGFTGSYARFVSLGMDARGVPYVAYADGLHGECATVMRFN